MLLHMRKVLLLLLLAVAIGPLTEIVAMDMEFGPPGLDFMLEIGI